MEAEPTVVDDRAVVLQVLKFTATPGPRYRHEGDWSGQQFREEYLEPHYLEAREAGKQLVVDLDGTEGYASSFLEEAFGGLARLHSIDEVLATIQIQSSSPRKWYKEEVLEEYIPEARDPKD